MADPTQPDPGQKILARTHHYNKGNNPSQNKYFSKEFNFKDELNICCHQMTDLSNSLKYTSL